MTKTRGASHPWTEEILQHVLVLNPALLRVQDHLPLALDGGSTSLGSDQLYVDEVGRLVIVEVKNERAGLKAMAQLLSYSEHWSPLPVGEVDVAYGGILARGSREDVMKAALTALRRWGKPASRSGTGAGKPAAEWTAWPSGGGRTVSEFATARWGAHALGLSGAPARKVLIAPAFDADALKFAKELAHRYVPIELVRSELLRDSAGGVVLSWECLVAPPEDSGATWVAARRLWRIPQVRERFTLNAWADPLNTSSFSFSAREAPEAKMWVDADERDVELSTCVPDGWYPGDAAGRKDVRKRMLAQLSPGCSGGRWLGRSFRLRKEGAAFDAFAARMADAIYALLVPAAPKRG